MGERGIPFSTKMPTNYYYLLKKKFNKIIKKKIMQINKDFAEINFFKKPKIRL